MTGPAISALTGCGTIAKALAALDGLFRAAGIPDSMNDARLLVCAALDVSRLDLALRPDSHVDHLGLERLRSFAERRLRREPVTRILGARGFWSLDLEVHADVLDPRPDSEIVVEAALKALGARKDHQLRVLDIGTGSGALMAALLSELPSATGCAIDVSLHAAAAARSNFSKLGLSERVTVLQQSWTEPLPGVFDLIVSNPPYIETGAIAELDPEVRDHDPILALDGGADGLTAYRALAARRESWIGPGGLMAIEIGASQAHKIKLVFESAGARMIALHQDYAGRDRAMVLADALV